MKDSMRKRMSLWSKKGDSEEWKIGDNEVWKIRKRQKPVEKGEKVDERRGWTEGKVEAEEGSTEARRKDDKGCTEVRNREEVPAFM